MRNLAFLAALPSRGAFDFPSELRNSQGQHRQNGQGDKREPPIHQTHYNERSYQRQKSCADIDECSHKEIAHHTDVAGQSRKKITGRGGVMERLRQTMNMAVKL
ncbi:hypothetical protein MnTg02_01738 [bacterium MnTg02]|nr:hypothetical protein MnTg02_01738 [bacterium MnTg02]